MRFLKQQLILTAMVASLAACSDDNEPETPAPPPEPESYSYTVTVSNLTAGQPLSPIGLIAHQQGQLWQVGEAATTALELMAEAGDNSVLLQYEHASASASSDGPLMPGQQVEVSITTASLENLKLSLVSMLVNTNDGFTGLNAMDVSSLELGQTLTYFTHAYDAGTEANSEASGTIPGPADGGEGFNEARDDINLIAMHPGVVSQQDGLTNSVLLSEHKFDNPVSKVVITRTE